MLLSSNSGISHIVNTLFHADSIEEGVEKLSNQGDAMREVFRKGVAAFKNGESYDAEMDKPWCEGFLAAQLGEV